MFRFMMTDIMCLIPISISGDECSSTLHGGTLGAVLSTVPGVSSGRPAGAPTSRVEGPVPTAPSSVVRALGLGTTAGSAKCSRTSPTRPIS